MINDNLNIRIFNGDLKGAIRVFQKRTQQSGLIGEIKRHNEFVDANKKRRLKSWRAQARKNRHKARGKVGGR